jgi:hypothetical protein
MGGRELGSEEIRQQVSEWQDATRIIFCVPGDLRPVRSLRALDVAAHGWRDKISIAWLVDGNTNVAPVVPNRRESSAAGTSNRCSANTFMTGNSNNSSSHASRSRPTW